MVNYSKWDNLDLSDDDEDFKRPRVQRFDGPQNVTIGAKNSGLSICPSSADRREDVAEERDDEPMECSDEELEHPEDDHREDILQLRALAERALKNGDAAEGVRLLEKAMKLGGAQCPGVETLLETARRQAAAGDASAVAEKSPVAVQDPNSHFKDGGVVDDRYSWSQTKETVEINLFVPNGTKAKDVAVHIAESKLSVVVSKQTIFSGDWEFKVTPEEDPDWEMKEVAGRRAVKITVKKAPMPGGMSIVVWWSRVLKGEPAIDVKGLEGRKKVSDSFSKAWEQAHVQFKESVAKREKIMIDVDGSEEKNEDAMES